MNIMDYQTKEEVNDNESDEEDELMKYRRCGRCSRTCRKGCCYVSKRYIVIVLSAVGMMLVYAMRTSLGVTVILILDFAPHTKVGTARAMWNVSVKNAIVTYAAHPSQQFTRMCNAPA